MICAALISTLLIPSSAFSAEAQGSADWQGVAVGADIGTLGLGGKATVCILPEYLNVRGGYSWAELTVNSKIRDIEYDMDLSYGSFPVMVDWHPFGNHFRISAGAIFNNNSAGLKAKTTDKLKIGDMEFTPAQVGTLKGDIKFGNSTAPYVGLGFGNAVLPNQALSFVFDLGVFFTGYDLSLTSEGGTMSDNPILLSNLEKEEKDAQEDLDKIKIYPVLSFGLAYHF